ncbi:MAG: CvpA family protein [Chitinophagaceae bacterium]|nr:MAG: CvpA family protein [Chitinophagaceae bacterium]
MVIDIIFLILMLMAVFKGYSKGFIVALFSVVGFIVGLAAALKLSVFVAEKLSGTFNASGKWLPVLSFILVLIVVMLLVRLGAKIIQSSVELVMLGWLNRLAGIVLFALLYAILYSVFLFYAVQLHVFSPEAIAASNVYPYIQPLGPKVINAMGTLIPWFKDMFAELQRFFESVPGKSPTTLP